MTMPRAKPLPDHAGDERLRDVLERGNRALAGIAPILGHLLAAPDQSLVSDELVARVRGMLGDLARQVLRSQAEATGHAAREEFAQQRGDALAAHFHASHGLLTHCHALALEWQLAARMEHSRALDPVLSPLLQDLLGNEDKAMSGAAMAALAAQARFSQAQRRMELPLRELPGDLFHEALLAWRAFNGDRRSDALTRAEAKLRSNYDESAGRLALFARLVAGMGGDADRALAIDHAGPSLFFSALAARSGQPRELAILSSNEKQVARLALGLRAAGLGMAEIAGAILALHPDAQVPEELALIGESEARELLADRSALGLG